MAGDQVVVLRLDGFEAESVEFVAFAETPRQHAAPSPGLGEYKASGTIAMSRQQFNLLMAAICPHGKAARRLARARAKVLRRAYLAAKVPRRLCDCLDFERTRRGGCANEGRDPDGNRFCMSLPF